MSTSSQALNPKPSYVAELEAIYGAPRQAGFGSAVFYEPVIQADNLEAAALKHYQYFVGELWERFGEAAWMSPWKLIYTRQPGSKPDIVAELRAIADPSARLSVPMLLDINDTDQAQKALSITYDNSGVKNLTVHTVGDGQAMSGILVAGQRSTGEATFLILLLD